MIATLKLLILCWLLKGLTRATNHYSTFFKVSLAKEKVTNIRHLVFFGVLDALVVSKSFNASAKNEQRRVDVSGFLLTVASVQGLLDAFRTGQVTERQHRHPCQMRLFLEQKKSVLNEIKPNYEWMEEISIDSRPILFNLFADIPNNFQA